MQNGLNSPNVGRILKLLAHRGWVKSRSIERELGVGGPTVRYYIRTLRRRGVTIAQSERGYKISRNIRTMESAVVNMQKRVNSMEQTIGKMIEAIGLLKQASKVRKSKRKRK